MHINQLDSQSLNQPSCIDTPIKSFKNRWGLYCPILGQCSHAVATLKDLLYSKYSRKIL